MIKTCTTPFGTFSNATTTPYAYVAIAQSKATGGLIAAWGITREAAVDAALETDDLQYVGTYPVDATMM